MDNKDFGFWVFMVVIIILTLAVISLNLGIITSRLDTLIELQQSVMVPSTEG